VSCDQQVQRVARVAFVEDDLVDGEPPTLGRAQELPALDLVEHLEYRLIPGCHRVFLLRRPAIMPMEGASQRRPTCSTLAPEELDHAEHKSHPGCRP
jgi:hypothetical protein